MIFQGQDGRFAVSAWSQKALVCGQSAPGGRMIIPVGGAYSRQALVVARKDKDGVVRTRSLMAVAFVPFVREDRSAR